MTIIRKYIININFSFKITGNFKNGILIFVLSNGSDFCFIIIYFYIVFKTIQLKTLLVS